MVRVPRLRRITQPVQAKEVATARFALLPPSAGSGNKLTCPVTGAVVDFGAAGYALDWNARANAVTIAGNPQEGNPIPFVSGGFPALSPTKHWTYIVGARVIDPLLNIRCALGDINALVSSPGYGWGFSDGLFHTSVATHMNAKQTMRVNHSFLNAGGPWADILSVAPLADEITTTLSHFFQTGDPTQVNIISGVLAPLSHGQIVYVRKTGADTLQLAPTEADAIAGTNIIDLTSFSGSVSLWYFDTAAWQLRNTDLLMLATWNPTAVSFTLSAYDVESGVELASSNTLVNGSVVPSDQSVTFDAFFRMQNLYLDGLVLLESTAALPNMVMNATAMAANWRDGKKYLSAGLMGAT